MKFTSKKIALFSLGLSFLAPMSAVAQNSDYKSRPPEAEITYFLLLDRFENGDKSNDKGGLSGDRLITGFDPSAKGFYHGGDLKGLISRLDYIKKLGATAVWLAPIFQNKPVQGPNGNESAAYHGYWITDFTKVDPHFGTSQDFKNLVDAAHARGMKVYMDIIANHTADVIYFKECENQPICHYRTVADYPQNAYTPFIPHGEENAKKPQWLNDPKLYNNRGNSNWWSEGALKGDFAGLDDIDTTNQRVIDGFIEIYGQWIDKYKIDGFRIDTVKHVDSIFWQKFVPAIKQRALKNGIKNFHIFGEVYIDGVNPGALAVYTKRDKMPSVLDFSFQSAVFATLAKNKSTDVFEALFDGDILYEDGVRGAQKLQTFVSNHDMGRLAMMIKREMPNIAHDELLSRVKLANAMMMTLRGSPTIYSGDEQGFVGDGHDMDAREDMFASNVDVYNDNDLLGTDKTTKDDNFDINHPLFIQISELAKIKKANDGLINGSQKLRKVSQQAGILAISRFNKDGSEVLLLFNTANKAITENVKTEKINKNWQSLNSVCDFASDKFGVIRATLAPFEYKICKAK